MSGISFAIEKIGPQRARELLAVNIDNRPVKRGHVRKLATAIERGEWVPNHQGIAISKNNRLLDGQHRLLAIIEANRAVPLTISYGWDDSAFGSLDRGRTRTIAEAMKLPQHVAETLRVLATLCEHSSGLTEARLSNRYGTLIPLIEELIEFCPSHRRGLSNAGVKAGAIIAVLEGAPKGYVMQTYRDVVLMNFDDLPPIGKAFIRQMADMRRINGDRQMAQLARAMIAFDPANSRSTKVQIKNMDVYRQRAQKAVLSFVGVE